MLTADSNAPGDAAAPNQADTAPGARTPGALLQALGWMAPPIYELAQRRPALAGALLGLDWAQLHLLGFALAHERAAAGPGTLGAAGGVSVRAVLRVLGMERLAGLGRVLRQLPNEPVRERDYRLIAELLADPATADILHNSAVVEKGYLRNLAGLPPALRTLPVVLALDDTPGGARVLAEWIALVAERRGDRDGGAWVTGHLATPNSLKELRARIVRLGDALPVPDGLPPAAIGNAQRLDTSTEIRRVAHAFGNCLRDRVSDVARGASLFYIWRAEDHAVVCELTRVNRLGWALCEHLGLKNATPGDDVICRIEADFRAAGVWTQLVAEFATTMVDNLGRGAMPTPRAVDRAASRLGRDDVDFDDADGDEDDLPRRRPRWPGF